PENPNESDYFGADVDIYEDYCIVGSPSTISGNTTGYANIYHNDSGLWTEQALLLASDGEDDDSFGLSVCIYESGALVGASYDDDNFKSNSGSVYYYNKSETGWENMTETQKIIAPDIMEHAYFGDALSIEGNSVAIGAFEDGEDLFGAVYLFSLTSGNWEFGQKITTEDAGMQGHFGSSVALSEDYLFVGARSDDSFAYEAGSVYVYATETTSIETSSETQILSFPNPTSGYVYFDSGNTLLKDITVTDIMGKTVFYKSSMERELEIDLSSFENGLFYVRIEMDNETFTSKILKQ
ncbi:MAG: hypothetical protein DRJ05_06220, partial [Bacteroidetes bacterium]